MGYETLVTGVVQNIDDGRVNGGDCAVYLLSLFEEVVGVCLVNGTKVFEVADYGSKQAIDGSGSA